MNAYLGHMAYLKTPPAPHTPHLIIIETFETVCIRTFLGPAGNAWKCITYKCVTKYL